MKQQVTILSVIPHHFQDVKDINKIVISSGFFDTCFLNGSSPGLQPVQTCKTGGIHNYSEEQTLEHASYKNDKAKKIPSNCQQPWPTDHWKGI